MDIKHDKFPSYKWGIYAFQEINLQKKEDSYPQKPITPLVPYQQKI